MLSPETEVAPVSTNFGIDSPGKSTIHSLDASRRGVSVRHGIEPPVALVPFSSSEARLEQGKFTVCKVAPEDSNQAFTFNTSVVNPQGTLIPTVDLQSLWCEDVFVVDETGGEIPAQTVTITEDVPDGWQVGLIAIWSVDANGVITREPNKFGTNTTSGPVDANKLGCLVIFVNLKEPPDDGGQGYTPGYWKSNAANMGVSAWGPTGVGPGDALSSVGFSGFTVQSGDATSFLDALNEGWR